MKNKKRSARSRSSKPFKTGEPPLRPIDDICRLRTLMKASVITAEETNLKQRAADRP